MSDYEDVSDSLYEYQPFSQKEYENYSFTETSTNSSNIDNSKGKQKKKKVENNTSGGFGNGDSEKTTPTNNDMNKEDLRSMALELAKREVCSDN